MGFGHSVLVDVREYVAHNRSETIRGNSWWHKIFFIDVCLEISRSIDKKQYLRTLSTLVIESNCYLLRYRTVTVIADIYIASVKQQMSIKCQVLYNVFQCWFVGRPNRPKSKILVNQIGNYPFAQIAIACIYFHFHYQGDVSLPE